MSRLSIICTGAEDRPVETCLNHWTRHNFSARIIDLATYRQLLGSPGYMHRTDLDKLSSPAEKLRYIDSFAADHPGEPVSHLVATLFPEIGVTSAAAPTVIRPNEPELQIAVAAKWRDDRQPGETPVAFIQRHYEPWLGKGLNKAHIYRGDRKLYDALCVWQQRNPLPEGFSLPTLKEANDERVRKVFGDGSDAASVPATAVQDAVKLGRLFDYRERKNR